MIGGARGAVDRRHVTAIHLILLKRSSGRTLILGDPGSIEITGWADQVRLVDATYAGPWELPVLGTVTAPAAVLIRPDGHVGLRADRNHIEALTAYHALLVSGRT